MGDVTPKPAAVCSPPALLCESQPYLLDERSLPLRTDLVAMVKEKTFTHSGKILTKDEALCRAVCLDLMAGLSGRKVAAKYNISRNSVLGIEHAMRERGELEPLRKVLLRQLDDCIYLGLERVQDALATDGINAGQLPIPLMAMIDKKAQLDAGIVPGTQRTEADISAESLRLEFEKMRKVIDVKTVPSETGSDAGGPNA